MTDHPVLFSTMQIEQVRAIASPEALAWFDAELASGRFAAYQVPIREGRQPVGIERCYRDFGLSWDEIDKRMGRT